MTPSFKELWYWAGGIVLLLACTITLIKFEGYFIPVMAAVAVTAAGILFHFIGIRQSFHLLLFSFPLSFKLAFASGYQIMFPSELLVVAFGISVLLHWIKNSAAFLDWCRLPLTIGFGGYLFFTLISVFTSEIVMVSLKSVTIKILYVIAFYGGGFLYFKQTKQDKKFIYFYLLPLLMVVGFVLFRHADFSFSKDVSGYVTKPFYQDHTIYSAALAFIVPLVAALAIAASGMKKFLLIVGTLLLVVALIFAASRAAWLSLAIAFIVGLLVRFRFPPIGFVFFFLIGTTVVYLKSDDLLWRLKSNRFDSSARNSGIEEQTKSVANITNDQSNAERINRWHSALRMFQEKPFTGFGPGTYQFCYFPFQREKEMTRISVKSAYNITEGRGGTAHNEFFLVLAESGALAAGSFLLIVLITLVIALKSCYELHADFMRLAMLMAFITFITHSLFNNFLDTDKTAVLYYIAIAFFASLQISTTDRSSYEK